MADKPLFSVCIPTYNHGKMLGNAISSVLSQSFTEFEMIILDNASTDNTSELLSKISDPRIRIFRNDKNISMYANHNLCIRHSNSENIIFLHSDDVLKKDALLEYRKIIARNHEVKIFIPKKDQHEFLLEEEVVLSGKKAVCFLLRFPTATPTGSLYKKSIFSNRNFDTAILAADLKFLLSVSLDEKIKYAIVPNKIVEIRTGKFQASANWVGSGKYEKEVSSIFGDLYENKKVIENICQDICHWKVNEIARILRFAALSNKRKILMILEKSVPNMNEVMKCGDYKHVMIYKKFGSIGLSLVNDLLRIRRKYREFLKNGNIIE